MLGNFDLHHPYWNGPLRLTQHTTVDQLLNIIVAAKLELTFFFGTVTWETCNLYNTINLIFMSSALSAQLKHYKIRRDMAQSLNHIPISIKFFLKIEPTLVCKRKTWKMIDMNKLGTMLKNAPVLRQLQSIANINTAVKKVQKFLCNVIDQTVPWATPFEWARPFWSNECNEITKTTR